jgi:diadenosine tetraphosphate (Ap4A) HIT family hydrolase
MNIKPISSKSFFFGNILIASSHIFLVRTNVFAFVNLKPICPGHVLVSSTRQVKRLSELSESETLDLWLTAQQVAKTMSDLYKVKPLEDFFFV